jgi:hypothetical protein
MELITTIAQGFLALIATFVTAYFGYRSVLTSTRVKELEDELKKEKEKPARQPTEITKNDILYHHFFSKSKALRTDLDRIIFDRKLHEDEPDQANELRKEHYMDIMCGKWNPFADQLHTFVLLDHQQMSELEFNRRVKSLMDESLVAYHRVLSDTVGPNVASRFLAQYHSYNVNLSHRVENILDSSIVYRDNISKVYALLDLLEATIQLDQVVIEKFIKYLNGYFSKLVKAGRRRGEDVTTTLS